MGNPSWPQNKGAGHRSSQSPSIAELEACPQIFGLAAHVETLAGDVELTPNAFHLYGHLDLSLVLKLFVGCGPGDTWATVSSSIILLKA